MFRAEDVARRFLAANEKMWAIFVPDLRRRLSDLDGTAPTTGRMRAALLDRLPGGAPADAGGGAEARHERPRPAAATP